MRTRGGEGVAGAAFDRAHRNAVGAAAKDALYHVRLHDVERRMPRAVGANVIDVLRRFASAVQRRAHSLPQSEKFTAGIIITLRAIPGYFQIRVRAAGDCTLVVFQDHDAGALGNYTRVAL